MIDSRNVVVVTPANAPFIPRSAADGAVHNARVLHIETSNLFNDLSDPDNPLLDRTLSVLQQHEKQGGGGTVALTIGYLSRHQTEFAAASSSPVVSSPLLALPLLLATLPADQHILVVYADSSLYKSADMPRVDVTQDDRVVVVGLEGPGPFRDAVIDRSTPFDAPAVLGQIEDLVQTARTERPLSAVVLECGEMAAIADDLRRRISLPVIDYHLLIRFFAESLTPRVP